MKDLLFAYGTLQPELAFSEVADLVAKFRRVGFGSLPGSMYDLDPFRGAILDARSPRRIPGTVFQLPEEDLLPQLDEYEGYNPDDPSGSLYLRELHPVLLDDGRMLNCWIYVYNRQPVPGTRILNL